MAQREITDQEWEPVDSEEWKPPTEAEMKVLQARRERSDKISKLMGSYLLKGYKMLGISCGICGTILLRSKQGADYCVSCVELDSDTVKDDPALNQEAARSQAAEQSQREGQARGEDSQQSLRGRLEQDGATSSNPLRSTYLQTQAVTEIADDDDDEKPCYSVSDLPPTEMTNPSSDVRSRCLGNPTVMQTANTASYSAEDQSVVERVQEKMMWASRELAQSQSVEYSKSVCELIKTCAETLRALSLIHTGNPQVKDQK